MVSELLIYLLSPTRGAPLLLWLTPQNFSVIDFRHNFGMEQNFLKYNIKSNIKKLKINYLDSTKLKTVTFQNNHEENKTTSYRQGKSVYKLYS